VTPLPFERISAALRSHQFPHADLVVALGTGGVVAGALVAHQLALPLEVLWVNHRDDANTPAAGGPRWTREPDIAVAGRTVLLVDDVYVSGRTLELARAWLVERGAHVVPFVLKGKVPFALFRDIGGCVQWPWKPR
jgi:xanthine phosphoribosyltransferase